MLYLFYADFPLENNKHKEIVIIKDIYREIPSNWSYKLFRDVINVDDDFLSAVDFDLGDEINKGI